VAVLPFVALPRDQTEAERFATEITEKLTGSSRLTLADPRQAGKLSPVADPQSAGRQLGVEAVLTGELMRKQGELSLKVKLIRVEDGRVLLNFSTGEVTEDAVDRVIEGWSTEVAKRVRTALQGK
jgi:TolB-like protein